MQVTPQQYIQRMLGLVGDKDPLEVQRETAKTLAKLIKPLTRRQLSQRPEPSKWSITEILAHLADSEIVLSWRMRLVICQNGSLLHATDQDMWEQTLDYHRHDPKVSLEIFRVLREHNLRMLKALPQNLWENYGMHSERGKETLTHIVRMYAGHDLNHLAQMEKIAKQSRSKRGA
jgi:DinB superfamily